MTETASESRRFSRRTFLKGTGAMVVAIGAPRLLNPKAAFAALEDFPIGPALVDPQQIDSWLAVHGNGTVTVFTGKVELGTGVMTTTMQLVDDELDVPLAKVTVVEGDTWRTVDQGFTAGSQSNKTEYAATGALRQAAAEARLALLNLASQQLGVPAAQLTVKDGVVSAQGDSSKSVSYAQLIGDKRFDVKITGKAMPKTFEQYRIVGTSVKRPDVAGKATGAFTYTQDVRIPGLVHARVVRPPTLDSTLVSVDGWKGSQPPGVIKVVAKRNYVAVVAKEEWQAIPLQMHGSMGASAATASVEGQTATVWSSTQGVYQLRGAIATALGVPAQNVHVIYVEGSGCYGLNGADNVALDAAVISQMVGKPVRVQYMRADEHRWENYGQPYTIGLRGGLDASGKVAAWDYTAWTASRGGRPGPPANLASGILLGFPENALAASPPQTPTQPPNFVDGSNSGPSYVIPSQRLVTHTGVHSFLAGPLRSPARIQNTFANESFIDELAHAAGADPVAFRLAHLKDQRLIDVIGLAAKMANWQERPAATKIGKGRFRTGRGIAAMLYEGNNGYNAAVFQVTVDTRTGKVVVDAVWSAQDCGPVLNPDGMRAQAEGCVMQAISRSLIEEVKWGPNGIKSKDWQTYPVIRFTAMPKTFKFQAIDRKDQPVWGAGEVLITNGPAAIANAIFDATGKRMRQLPFTPARVRAALKS